MNGSSTEGIAKKVLGSWKGWNHPYLMAIVVILSFVPASIVALTVAPEYTESAVMEYALMAILMFGIVQGVMILAAIFD